MMSNLIKKEGKIFLVGAHKVYNLNSHKMYKMKFNFQ